MLGDFLNENGIKPEDVVTQSRGMEALGVADRAIDAQRRIARANKKTYAELNLEKPKMLGRGVSAMAVKRAIEGSEMSRLVRKKIARAVNAVLQSKKKEPVEWRKLFADVKSKKGESKKKA
jgi:hypothetical protein